MSLAASTRAVAPAAQVPKTAGRPARLNCTVSVQRYALSGPANAQANARATLRQSVRLSASKKDEEIVALDDGSMPPIDGGNNGGEGNGRGDGNGGEGNSEDNGFPYGRLALAFGAVVLGGAAGNAYAAKKAPAKPAAPDAPSGFDLYSRFALAGALCCGLSHGAATPIDVIKTQKQLSPQTYPGGVFDTAGKIVKNKGAGALLTGLSSTFFGYCLQGCFKFGGYEYFKKYWVDKLGMEEAKKNRTAIYMASAASAEFIADIALCPLEACRIRLVSDPTYANGLAGCAGRLMKEEGLVKGFYSGFVPMLFKQVPYTMAKFVVFEALSEKIYEMMPTPKSEMSAGTITCINLGSGVGAGVVSAIVSQPADTLLSMINKAGAGGDGPMFTRLGNICSELGVGGLYRGLGARCVMVGSITALQFAIYGDIKRLLNAKGGTDIAK